MRPHPALRIAGTAARDIKKQPRAFTPIVRSQAASGTSSISFRSAPCGAPALLTRMSSLPCRRSTSSTIRAASASTLTSPSAADAVPPASTSAATRLSTPRQLGSMSPWTLCSLATPVGATSDTTTVTPAAASAWAVALPMPTGLPQPVIRATRASLGTRPSSGNCRCTRRCTHCHMPDGTPVQYQRAANLTYTVAGIPPAGRVLLLGVQYAALDAFFLVLVAIIVRHSHATIDEKITLMGVSCIALAVGTTLQALRHGP